jgi:predicted nucleic acid-binding protein
VVTGLLDSAVLVDVLRGYQPAEDRLAEQAQLGVTRVVWLELLEGAQNKTAQAEAIKLLRRFVLVDLTPDDMAWAVKQLTLYGLSHNVGAFDCLIASVHPRLKVPLYTRNLKHFTPIIGSLAVSPYA